MTWLLILTLLSGSTIEIQIGSEACLKTIQALHNGATITIDITNEPVVKAECRLRETAQS